MSEMEFGLHSREEIERFRAMSPEERMRLAVDLMRQVDRIFLTVPPDERQRRLDLYYRCIKDVGTQRLVEKFRSLP